MPANYFWNGEEVIVVEERITADMFVVKGFEELLCIDTYRDSPRSRYGKFIHDPKDQRSRWQYVPLEEFPPEFRTHLLLLEVT